MIFDNPIVLLSQPFKYNHFQKKIVYQDKALIFDKNDYKINLDLKIENKKRKKVIWIIYYNKALIYFFILLMVLKFMCIKHAL